MDSQKCDDEISTKNAVNHNSLSYVDEKESEGNTPRQKVKAILQKVENGNRQEICPLFSEMEELVGEGDNMEWRESARLIKFEENVEEGGNRWSKPFVATLPLHSVFELKRLLKNGSVVLDIEGTTIEQISDLLITTMVNNNSIPLSHKSKVKEILLKRHRHQHQIELPSVRLITSFGRKNSTSMKTNGSNTSTNHVSPDFSKKQYNFDFMKKIPTGAEASNVLVGEVEFLEKPLMAFARLKTAAILGDLTEVPVPTRFLFLLLGPSTAATDYREVGRTMATMMTDQIFREVAYRASNRNHLLAGIDEFLDAALVLPPNEWDPAIRIEPPPNIPSQDDRRGLLKFDEDIDEDEAEQRRREHSGLARSGILFGGLINDIKRKTPFYLSDFKDAFSTQSIASWIFLYFACLSPCITFGGILSEATGSNIAAMEALVGGFICGVVYGFFSGQPLAILAMTGPVLVFETIIYELCTSMDWDYMSFRFWIGTWMSIILLIVVATDASAFVSYITKFTEEIFAILIAVIFIFKAIENVCAVAMKYPITPGENSTCLCTWNDTVTLQQNNISTTSIYELCQQTNGTLSEGCSIDPQTSNITLMSIILFFGTYLLSVRLKKFKTSPFFSSTVRQLVSDFSVTLAICFMTLVDYYVGIPTPKLQVPHEFKPTLPGRGWIIAPFNNNPMYTAFLALPPAILGTILIFMDQQITVVIVNRKEYKLRKGCGYHLDIFIISILIEICSIMGLPWFVAATVQSIIHVHSLKLESESVAPGDKPQFLGVREQRVTHILIFFSIGLSIFLAPMLRHIPMPVLFGVFLYMGMASLNGLDFFDRILLMFMPNKYQPDYKFLRQVPTRKVHLFTLIQLVCIICLWLINSFSQTSILFPLMLVVMVAVRKSLDRVFTRAELIALDDLMPQSVKRSESEDQKTGCCGSISRILLGPKLNLDKRYTMCDQIVR